MLQVGIYISLKVRVAGEEIDQWEPSEVKWYNHFGVQFHTLQKS